MRCPDRCQVCGGETRVLDTARSPHDGYIRRRRQCLSCGHRHSTAEVLLDTLREIEKLLLTPRYGA